MAEQSGEHAKIHILVTEGEMEMSYQRVGAPVTRGQDGPDTVLVWCMTIGDRVEMVGCRDVQVEGGGEGGVADGTCPRRHGLAHRSEEVWRDNEGWFLRRDGARLWFGSPFVTTAIAETPSLRLKTTCCGQIYLKIDLSVLT